MRALIKRIGAALRARKQFRADVAELKATVNDLAFVRLELERDLRDHVRQIRLRNDRIDDLVEQVRRQAKRIAELEAQLKAVR